MAVIQYFCLLFSILTHTDYSQNYSGIIRASLPTGGRVSRVYKSCSIVTARIRAAPIRLQHFKICICPLPQSQKRGGNVSTMVAWTEL